MHEQLASDIQEVNELRTSFYYSLGLNVPDEVINFDIPIEKWTYERYFIGRNKQFKEYEEKQVETALKERFGIATNVFIYSVDKDGDLINSLVPDEKFKVFLRRGILYRESIGSKEQERENAELNGFIEIANKLTDKKTPIGTMMISISGTGIVENTFYPKNFVDIYEKVRDKNGQIVIKMTRFQSSNDYKEYVQKALTFNPNYFDNLNGPIDAWFLNNPIPVKPQEKFGTPEELFSKMFNNEKKSMEENQFQELIEYCMPLITNFINLLTSDILDPEAISANYNAILNKADLFAQNDEYRGEVIYQSVEKDIFTLGRQIVKAVESGCGISGGIKLGNRFENSVAKFGEKWTYHNGDCVNCNKTNTEVGPCNICKECEKIL